MISSVVLRPLRIPAYLILAVATLLPVLENVASLWPAHPSSAAWRFGAVGSMSGILSPTMIGLLLLVVVASFAGDWPVLIGTASFCALLSLATLAGAAAFILDAVQTRAQVRAPMVNRFDFAATLALTRLLFVAVASGLLAWVSFRLVRLQRSRPAALANEVLMPPRVSEKRAPVA